MYIPLSVENWVKVLHGNEAVHVCIHTGANDPKPVTIALIPTSNNFLYFISTMKQRTEKNFIKNFLVF